MFCNKCGKQLENGVMFCPECGAKQEIVMPVKPEVKSAFGGVKDKMKAMSEERVAKNEERRKAQAEKERLEYFDNLNAKQYPIAEQDDDYSKVFVNSEEKLVASIGKKYNYNLHNKKAIKIKQMSSLLTDKRVYFKGLIKSNGARFASKEEKVVNLADITSTGFGTGDSAKLWALILGLVILGVVGGLMIGSGGPDPWMLIPLAVALVLIIIYLIARFSRTIYCFVDYAGGRIEWNERFGRHEEMENYLRSIRIAKDALENGSKAGKDAQ